VVSQRASYRAGEKCVIDLGIKALRISPWQPSATNGALGIQSG